MIAFHMFCDRDGARARDIAAPLIDAYLRSLVDARPEHGSTARLSDYPATTR